MNHKQYLLDLLDGSQSLSHEGIGMVVERLERLEAVVEAAFEEMPNYKTQTKRIQYPKFTKALAALEGKV